MPHIPRKFVRPTGETRSKAPTTSEPYLQPDLPTLADIPSRKEKPQVAFQGPERARLGLERISMKKWDVSPEKVKEALFDGPDTE